MFLELSRVLSRILLVPFDLPSCGPVTTKECQLYTTFQNNCEGGKYSPIVRWVINQGNRLEDGGDTRFQEIRDDLQKNARSLVSRNIMSWAVSLYFLEKVGGTLIVPFSSMYFDMTLYLHKVWDSGFA